MPLPTPKGKQGESGFVSKCMSDPKMGKEFPDQKKRAAVCYSQYERVKRSKGCVGEPKWEDTNWIIY